MPRTVTSQERKGVTEKLSNKNWEKKQEGLSCICNINFFLKIFSKYYEIIRMGKAGGVGFIILLHFMIGNFGCWLHDIRNFALLTAIFSETQNSAWHVVDP